MIGPLVAMTFVYDELTLQWRIGRLRLDLRRPPVLIRRPGAVARHPLFLQSPSAPRMTGMPLFVDDSLSAAN
jgi:hypothetical protein